MINNPKHLKLSLSIFLIWLFHLSGIIGILIGYEAWFASLTYINLFVCFFSILINEFENNKKILVALLVPFSIGLITEYLGVNFGFIFGTYQYGENLGLKFQGVPFMIGINWAILIYATSMIVRNFIKQTWLICLLASLLMVFLDLFMEQVAPRFDFWKFANNQIPIQNYYAWFLISYLAHWVFLKFSNFSENKLSFHIYAAFLLFFIIFTIHNNIN
jgi:bisanhydrobacterioruberin hydratase